ncbi:MAG TPA: hypothetical protein VG370_34060 [Chloroflexota bacterium]|jgi:H+/Cl- antiporter ClcA|nr:hypothetical protein [Chloroflexota bacterium]
MPVILIGLALQTAVTALAVLLLLEGEWLRAATGLQLPLLARLLVVTVIVLLLVGSYDEVTTYLSNQRGEPPRSR